LFIFKFENLDGETAFSYVRRKTTCKQNEETMCKNHTLPLVKQIE